MGEEAVKSKKLSWVLWEGDLILEVSPVGEDRWIARICLVENKRAVLVWSFGAPVRETVRKEGMRQLRAMQEPTIPDIKRAA